MSKPSPAPLATTGSAIACWHGFGAITLFISQESAGKLVPYARRCRAGTAGAYLNAILADMLTPAGVPLLWPASALPPILAPRKAATGRALIRQRCSFITVWMPQTFAQGNSAVRFEDD